MRTAFPLGLNDKLDGFGLHGNASDSRFGDYNLYRIENLCRKWKNRNSRNRHRRKKKGGFSESDFRDFKDRLLSLDGSDIESVLFCKQRKFLERFALSEHVICLYQKTVFLLRSRVSYFRKTRPSKKQVSSINWDLSFQHKILSDVNIRSVLNNAHTSNLLPSTLKGKFDINIIFKYCNTIGSKILNYNKVLKDVGLVSYNDILEMTCNCHESNLKDAHFDHIITGNLDIIREPKLREICSYGTKFRENPRFDLFKIQDCFLKSLDNLVAKISQKFRISRVSFKNWKRSLFANFKSKLWSCANTNRYRQPILSNLDSKKELDRLKKDFVITVVDKAAGNFAFICKKLYFLKLAEELGLNNPVPGNDTYCFAPGSEADLVRNLKTGLASFNIIPNDKENKLALLYQTPKFHKNPPKMRYIAGNISTVTTKLDTMVALILKMCKSHFRNLCNKNKEFSGRRCYFDVSTSMEVKGMFDEAHGVARSISINDFSTLYTLFDHDHLISNMSWLLHKLARNSGHNFIRIGYDRAWWVANNIEGTVYSLSEVLDMVEFLVRNTYIRAFGSIFRQVKGIIMGGKSSGWLSDCSLMVDEFRYIDSKIKAGLIEEADSLRFFRRYRDDCTTLNLDNFLDIAREMYPPSLTLTQENDDDMGANVLDMVVNIQDNNIITKVFCKTDFFPFNVISLPFLDSNLDTNVCYRVFYGQIIRFQRLCSNLVDFEERTKFLANILLTRGYNKKLLQKQFCKALEKYIEEFQKWTIPLRYDNWFKEIIQN